MKNGPRTLLSVALPTGGLLSASTRAETPRTSERRMNSWRRGVHVLPVRVRKSIVLIHSSVVMLWQEEDAKGGSRQSECAGSEEKRWRKDVLCLGDKFMKLADKILEDEPYASASPYASTCSTGVRYITYGFGASSVSLSKLAVITSGLSGY